MKTKPPCAYGLALSLSILIAIPADVCAAPQAAGQRAGEVSRVIPAVSIARSGKTITAAAKTAVDWQDLVNTQVNARARIALDDGSVLNVGSESSMKVVKHDAGAQQTELELTYGKLRTQAQKIAKPDGKFEVRTPAGVAGVVGTDFFVAFDNSVRSGDNSGPLPPQQATLDLLVASSKDTDPGVPVGVTAAGAHLGVLGTVGIVAGAVGVGLGVGLTRSGTPVQRGCVPATGKGC